MQQHELKQAILSTCKLRGSVMTKFLSSDKSFLDALCRYIVCVEFSKDRSLSLVETSQIKTMLFDAVELDNVSVRLHGYYEDVLQAAGKLYNNPEFIEPLQIFIDILSNQTEDSDLDLE